jgi:hypothetical protein
MLKTWETASFLFGFVEKCDNEHEIEKFSLEATVGIVGKPTDEAYRNTR